MPALSYSGETDAQTQADATGVIGQLIAASAANNGLSIDSISMRVNDSGESRIMVSVSASGAMTEVQSLADDVAAGAVNLGFADSEADAKEAMTISGGVD